MRDEVIRDLGFVIRGIVNPKETDTSGNNHHPSHHHPIPNPYSPIPNPFPLSNHVY
jgi:hypothetical protein